MAFAAGDTGMLSHKLKGRLIMIEPSGRPVKRIMAALTVCAAGSLKLPVVNILVAVFAACRQFRECLG